MKYNCKKCNDTGVLGETLELVEGEFKKTGKKRLCNCIAGKMNVGDIHKFNSQNMPLYNRKQKRKLKSRKK